MNKSLYGIFGLSALLMSSLVAEVTLIDELNGTNDGTTITTGWPNRTSSGWYKDGASSWAHGAGNTWIFNTSLAGGVASDGALAQVVDLSSVGLTNESQLQFDMTYSAWTQSGTGATDTNVYVHLWGLVNDAPTDGSLANLGAQNGNMWVDAIASGFTAYNLGTGVQMTSNIDGGAGGAAIQLLNLDTGDSLIENAGIASVGFDLSGYDLDTLAQYDYLVVGIAREVASDGKGFAIHDIKVTATVPEPNSYALIGGLLTLGCVMMRRRRA